jgi:glycosyltransferase involved in cell wall biosynthesis
VFQPGLARPYFTEILMKSILILLHCESNTGYAIGPLEATFFQMALALCQQDRSRIHFGYPSMKKGPSDTLPSDFNQYVIVDTKNSSTQHGLEVQRYIEQHSIDTVFGFDQPVTLPIYKYLRRAGVRHFISYWGAPMSSIFGRFKRTLKQVELMLRTAGPDHYVFESMGMADMAVLGRGIRRANTSVVYLGVDTERFRPSAADAGYAYEHLGIPPQRRIFFYAGHMESRKGVAVIMRAANALAEQRTQDDWQVALFGNQPGEETRYVNMLSAKARQHVMFGGYRRDLERIQRSCYAAMIASTGWDSFPRTGIEMQASGLPLLASSLPGLRESVEQDFSGYLFPPDDHIALKRLMERLLDDSALRDKISRQARERAEQKFSLDAQLHNLIQTVRAVVEKNT